MTGYANASASPVTPVAAALHERRADTRSGPPALPRIGVELRSVNGRFLDLVLRLPDEHRALEPALRELLTALPVALVVARVSVSGCICVTGVSAAPATALA